MGFFTVNEAKARLQITTDSHDTLIEYLIDDVGALLEAYCDRHFSANTYTEYHNGTGSNYILTKEWPINSITSLYDDPDRSFTSASLIDSDNYTFIADEGKIVLIEENVVLNIYMTTLFQKGVQNIKIIYNAGYTTVPSDLKLIAAEIMMKKYKNFMDKRIGMRTVGSGDERIGMYLNDMLPDHRMILDAKYRNRGSF